jgi:hypothetical protein
LRRLIDSLRIHKKHLRRILPPHEEPLLHLQVGVPALSSLSALRGGLPFCRLPLCNNGTLG